MVVVVGVYISGGEVVMARGLGKEWRCRSGEGMLMYGAWNISLPPSLPPSFQLMRHPENPHPAQHILQLMRTSAEETRLLYGPECLAQSFSLAPDS
ncbi:hypothetical protein E2C01_001700 [Portunus trituberculatus]|uniref:Uncharacterized protein n=1 Tax=Portunus trituberculatus TaxID=210409 RepID=A0A5B7CHV0_PORTR|nr:hypothetical protein [Portunus trituberculatus]